jgi:hypothetical protein
MFISRESESDNAKLEFKRSTNYLEGSVTIPEFSRGCEAAKACYYIKLTLRYEGMGIDRD